MPVDSMLVAAAVVLMFSVFGVTMAWAERRTRTNPSVGATTATDAPSPRRRPQLTLHTQN
jgi:hypothetical protein